MAGCYRDIVLYCLAAEELPQADLITAESGPKKAGMRHDKPFLAQQDSVVLVFMRLFAGAPSARICCCWIGRYVCSSVYRLIYKWCLLGRWFCAFIFGDPEG